MALIVSSLPAAAAAPDLAAAGQSDVASLSCGMGAIVASSAAAPTSHAVQLVRKPRGFAKVMKRLSRFLKPAAQPYQQAVMQDNMAV
jgi:hypothetical protein